MRGWWALEVEVPAASEDEAAGRLGIGSLGVEIVSSIGGVSRIRSYHGDEAAALRALAAAGGFAGQPVLRPIEDERWVERWQAALRPLPLGERFLVVPGETPHESGGRQVIRIVPGMAFGTGEHETTRLAAAALEAAVEPGSRWLDLGTGSGVLAVVATKCGADGVRARDIDPDAVAVATDTMAANGLSGEIAPEEGSLGGLEAGSFDGVVANIAGGFFERQAEGLREVLAPGGVLLATGIVADDVEAVERRLVEAGFTIEARAAEGDWRLVRARAEGG